MLNADSGIGGGGGFGDAVVALIAVIVVIFVVTLFSVIRRMRQSRKVRAGGVDPRTLGAQIALQLAHGTALPSGMTIEQHVAELESLHALGTISDEEYAAARAKAIGT